MRRHRLNVPEVGPVKDAVENELYELCQMRHPNDEFKAHMLFRVWWRLYTHRQGQPNYPKPLTWNTMASHLHTGMVPFSGILNYAVKPEGSP